MYRPRLSPFSAFLFHSSCARKRNRIEQASNCRHKWKEEIPRVQSKETVTEGRVDEKRKVGAESAMLSAVRDEKFPILPRTGGPAQSSERPAEESSELSK